MRGLYLIPLMLILLVSIVGATEVSMTFEQGVQSEIIVPCIDSAENPCTNVIACNISVNYPNGSIMIENDLMTFKSLGNFNYSLAPDQTEVLGTYLVSRPCASPTESGFTRFAYQITPTGAEKATASEGLILIMSIIVMTLFSLFFFTLAMKVNSGTMSLIFIFISGVLLFTTVMFTITMVSDNLSHLGSAMEGYATYLLVIKGIVSISVTFLVLYAMIKAWKIWGLKRGLIIE